MQDVVKIAWLQNSSTVGIYSTFENDFKYNLWQCLCITAFIPLCTMLVDALSTIFLGFALVST